MGQNKCCTEFLSQSKQSLPASLIPQVIIVYARKVVEPGIQSYVKNVTSTSHQTRGGHHYTCYIDTRYRPAILIPSLSVYNNKWASGRSVSFSQVVNNNVSENQVIMAVFCKPSSDQGVIISPIKAQL